MVSKYCRMSGTTILLTLVFVIFSPSVTALDVTSDITLDTIWRIEDSPVIVRGDEINKGKVAVTASLTIEPGVEVQFDGPNSLIIRKELIAIGTAEQPITFKPLAFNGQWVSIEFRTEDPADPERRVWTTYNNGQYESGSTLQYVTLESGGGLDFSQTTANGVLYMLDANPYLNHVTIRNGQSTAITVEDLSNLLKIDNAIIENNNQSDEVDGRAGGIAVVGRAKPAASGELEISNSTISGNITNSLDGGGGINVGIVDKLSLINNIIENNQSTQSRGGGVILLGLLDGAGAQSDYVISGNTIADNIAQGNGGGMSISASHVSFTNNRIINNISLNGDGGGLYFDIDAQADNSENIMMGNVSEGAGGGVFVEQVDSLVFSFRNNVIAGNTSASHGGGLDIGHDEGADIQSGNLTIDSNIIADNFADRHSGAMNITAVGSVTNNAIVRNESRSILFVLSPTVAAPLPSDPVELTVSQNAFFYNNAENAVFSNGANVLPIVNNNNIIDNGAGYYLHSSLTVPPMDDPLTLTFDGSNNYFDADEATVAANVSELVNYTPIANQIFENTPISPPNNVDLQNNNGSVTLSWDANPETDLQGYVVYWGTNQAPDYQTRETPVSASTTSYVISGLDSSQTYYFAVTAIDNSFSDTADIATTIVNESQTSGNESWYSEEVMVVGTAGGGSGGGSGGGGGGGGSLNALVLVLLIIVRLGYTLRRDAARVYR